EFAARRTRKGVRASELPKLEFAARRTRKGARASELPKLEFAARRTRKGVRASELPKLEFAARRTRKGVRASELPKLAQEPWIDAGPAMDLLGVEAAAQRLEQVVEALGAAGLERREQRAVVLRRAWRRVELARAQRLGERLLERPPDRHRLPHRLHVGGQPGLGARELLEREARPLDHAVVDRGLEAGGRGARDVVGDLL